MSYTITNDLKSPNGSNSLNIFLKIRVSIFSMKKLIFWGVIAAMFILGGGGAGAYISHANTQTHNNTSYNNSNKKNADPDQQKSNNMILQNPHLIRIKSSPRSPAHQTRSQMINQVLHLLQAITSRNNHPAANPARLPQATINHLP